MSATKTIFAYAWKMAEKEYETAKASGESESDAREACKAGFYYGLFHFFMNTNLSKWKAAN